eukprot:1161214-Pelagomonas_calceolata.AAC.1
MENGGVPHHARGRPYRINNHVQSIVAVSYIYALALVNFKFLHILCHLNRIYSHRCAATKNATHTDTALQGSLCTWCKCCVVSQCGRMHVHMTVALLCLCVYAFLQA